MKNTKWGIKRATHTSRGNTWSWLSSETLQGCPRWCRGRNTDPRGGSPGEEASCFSCLKQRRQTCESPKLIKKLKFYSVLVRRDNKSLMNHSRLQNGFHSNDMVQFMWFSVHVNVITANFNKLIFWWDTKEVSWLGPDVVLNGVRWEIRKRQQWEEEKTHLLSEEVLFLLSEWWTSQDNIRALHVSVSVAGSIYFQSSC